MVGQHENHVEPRFCHFNEEGELVITDSVNKKTQSEPILDLSNFSIKEIIDIVCKFLKVSRDDLSAPLLSSQIVQARGIIAYYCHYHANYTLTDIAYYFAQRPDGVSRNLHKQIKGNESTNLMKMLRLEFLKFESEALLRKDA